MLLTGVIAFVTGCNKDSVSPVPLEVQTGKPSEIVQRIESFINNANSSLSGTPKDGETSTITDAVWGVEAALNYVAGDLGKSYEYLTTGSISVPMQTLNDQVSADAMYAAYNSALSVIAPLTTIEQHVILVDVVEPVPGSSSLEIVYQIGAGYEKGAPSNTYGVNDDYIWGRPTGYSWSCQCGTNPSSSPNCANKVIEARINAANIYAIHPDEVVTDVEIWKVRNEPTSISLKRYSILDPLMAGPAPLGDGYHDTKTFYESTQQSAQTCLNETEMAYYTGNATLGTWSAITAIQGIHCPTKLFLASSSDAYSYYSGSGTALTFTRMHRWSFTYGRISPATNG